MVASRRFDATFDVDQTDASSSRRGPARPDWKTLDVPSIPSVPVFEDGDRDGYLDESHRGRSEVLSTEGRRHRRR